MTMTANEILTSYKMAKNKKEQIKILSELNCCSKDEILYVIAQNVDKIKNTKYVKDMSRSELMEVIEREREAYQVLEQMVVSLQKEVQKLKGE